MKKLLSAFIVLLLTMTLAACELFSPTETQAAEESPTATNASEDSETETETTSLPGIHIGTTTETETESETESESTTESESETLHEHSPVTDPRVQPTCIDTGLTEGSHCSICSEVLVQQEVLPATGVHTYGSDGVCSVCKAAKPESIILNGIYNYKDSVDFVMDEKNGKIKTSSLVFAGNQVGLNAAWESDDGTLAAGPASGFWAYGTYEIRGNEIYWNWQRGADYIVLPQNGPIEIADDYIIIKSFPTEYVTCTKRSSFDHEIKAETVHATCQEYGYIQWVCTTCEFSKIVSIISEEVPCQYDENMLCIWCGKKGCRHENTYEDIWRSATCTKVGYVDTVCSECGWIVDEGEIPATGHQYNDEGTRCIWCGECRHKNTSEGIWQNATCTEVGYVKTICMNCISTVNITEIPATGHQFEGGVCVVCGCLSDDMFS